MKKKLKGSITVEVTCLLPIVALCFVLSVWGAFYFYDKNILTSCAYEAAVVGSTKIRENDYVTEEDIEEILKERTYGKCLLFSEIEYYIQIKKEAVVVRIVARRREMKTSVIQTAAITEPELYIRKIQILK